MTLDCEKMILVTGDQVSGWLCVESIQNREINARSLAFKFEIQFDGSGYLICSASLDGTLYADTWHPTLEEAKQVAHESFGINSNEWTDGSLIFHRK